MHRAHKIRLKPNKAQETYFRKACGAARFSYNWALATWKEQYEAGEKPSVYGLVKLLNSLKKEEWPWMYETTKCAPEYAIHDLGTAFQRFFKKLGGYPKFKKKGRDKDSFHLPSRTFKTKLKMFWVPKLGWVRMYEELRFIGKLISATISREADRWFASIIVELPDPEPLPTSDSQIGIDLGITHLATLSDGTKIEGPRPLKRLLGKARRLSRLLARKQKGSKNRAKAAMKLAKHHAKISRIRNHTLHQLSHDLTKNHGLIAIEDLNVSGMVKNRRLARSLSDMGFGELRRQLDYKAKERGRTLVVVDRWFPSSKTCSSCSHKLDSLPLSVRSWSCPACSTLHDRDINAAINILNAVKTAVSACGGDPAQVAPLKQEVSERI